MMRAVQGSRTAVSATVATPRDVVSARSVARRGVVKALRKSSSLRRSSPRYFTQVNAVLADEYAVTQEYSGLQGQALLSADMDFPSKKEVLSAIPAHCFERDTVKSLMYAAISTAITVGLGVFAWAFIPLKLAWLPAWLAYAYAAGTAATGMWVVAHECGHGAFSDNKTIQDTVGYILHSALLVPYFSWQRSHAVHHSRTNHMTEGETHVPVTDTAYLTEPFVAFKQKLKDEAGEGPFAIFHIFVNLVFGWPAYLLTGATGGPARGKTNHFVPSAGASGKHALFPGQWKKKVWQSDVGVLAVIAGLGYWAVAAGSIWPLMALYVAPYMVCNAWLVMYTWLQHTDVDVPHFGAEEWNWSKGTFMTIDRPYGAIFDFLHHKIGSTHVAHHISHQIPHYHAQDATDALKENFPEFYLYDPTPIPEALWRIGKKCEAVEERTPGKWYWKTA